MNLLKPIKVGKITLKNRIMFPPMTTGYEERDGSIGEQSFNFYKRLAQGDVAYIVLGDVAPVNTVSPTPKLFHDGQIEAFKKLSDALHEYDCKLGIQIFHPEYDVEGMFTHFSTADCHDLEYFDSQVKKFDHFKKMLRIKPKYIHCDNSAASIFNRQVDSDLVRYGIAMYGLNPSSAPHGIEIQPKFTLQPALCFVSELVFVKQIHANNAVGYGATFKADTDDWIGTVPVGYADGWQRSMQGFKVKVGDD